jgi:DNA-binding PadR family transcriptional regulator
MAIREPTFYILTALARRSLHGYGIMSAVDELSDGTVKLQAGTLYAALERLTSEGLVSLEREEAVDGRLRRYYRLTDQGRTVLAEEVARLRRKASVAAAQLRIAPTV